MTVRLFAATVAAAWIAAGCAEPGPARPNIVLIVTDDQAAATLPYMPILQRELVAKGTTFESFILNDPLCCPSRVTILLGQYRHNHQLEVGRPGGCAYRFFEDKDAGHAIGPLIQGAGYRTGMIGKYLNSYDRYFNQRPDASENPLLVGWDDWHVLAHRHPKYFDFFMHENGELVHHDRRPPVYQTDYLAQLATRFIGESSSEKPFFLYIAPLAPHGPSEPALRHRSLFQEVRAPHVQLAEEARQPIDERFRNHLQTLQAVDEMVGAIVGELERSGQLDNTYIFFASDNGFHFGEHGIIEGKSTPFEESIRFPLIVRGPGVADGVSRSEIASNVDLHPTLLDLIGLAANPSVDGRSLLPLLRRDQEETPWRQSVVIESQSGSRTRGVAPFVGLRGNRYKLVRYGDGERALYDLREDPRESHNLIEETGAEFLARLQEHLDALLSCHGDSCRELENQRVEARPPEAH